MTRIVMANRLAAKIEDAKQGDVFTMDIGTGAKVIEYLLNFRRRKVLTNKN